MLLPNKIPLWVSETMHSALQMCLLSDCHTPGPIPSVAEKVVDTVAGTSMAGGGELRLIKDPGRRIRSANVRARVSELGFFSPWETVC